MVCPENHPVSVTRENFAKDYSEDLVDAYFRPMHESGLFCLECDRAYGLSKLKEPEIEQK